MPAASRFILKNLYSAMLMAGGAERATRRELTFQSERNGEGQNLRTVADTGGSGEPLLSTKTGRWSSEEKVWLNFHLTQRLTAIGV